MHKAVRETLKAVGWMFAGAILLMVAWFAFAQLVLVERFGLHDPDHPEGPFNVAGDEAEARTFRPRYSRPYNRSIMSHIYAPNAAPALPDEHAKAMGGWTPDDPRLLLEHAVTGHRVVIGSGAMLNYQRYSDDVSPPETTDRAVFEKITIFLPENIPDDYGHLSLSGNSEIIVFWSRGSPDLDKGQMCAGYATSGEIEYRRVSDKLEAKLTFKIAASGTVQPDGKACEPFTFRYASEFWTSEVDRLEQWNGGGWGKVSVLECMPSR